MLQVTFAPKTLSEESPVFIERACEGRAAEVQEFLDKSTQKQFYQGQAQLSKQAEYTRLSDVVIDLAEFKRFAEKAKLRDNDADQEKLYYDALKKQRSTDFESKLLTKKAEELKQVKASQLRKRASEAGASAEQVDEAEDSDSPKDAFIALIVELEMGILRDYEDKASQLRKRARELGASAEQADEAEDSDSPKDAFIALIVELEMAKIRADEEDHEHLNNHTLNP